MTRAEQRRAAQARYATTAKGRATKARYRASAKGVAAETAANARRGALRLYIGQRYIGVAESPAVADIVNTHIKERLLGFKQGFTSRAQAESVSTGAVQAQAES